MTCSLTANATLLLEDYFDYNLGQLPGQGGWLASSHNGSQKLNVVNMPLTYSGYQDAAKGKAAYISTSLTEGTDQDAYIVFTDLANAYKSGKVYASMLVKVEDPSSDDVYALGFAQAIKETGIIEGKSLSHFAKVFFKKNTADNTKYKIGFSRYGSKPEVGALSEDLNVGETVLIVMCYEFASAQADDVVHLWVNPVCGKTEPAATFNNIQGGGSGVSRSLGIQGFELRQGTTAGGKIGPKLYVDALRIADNWADLFPEQGGGGDPSTDAVISPVTTTVSFDTADGYLMQGLTSEKTIVVKAQNLTDDITVESQVPGLTLSATTISKEEACSDAGATLTLTLKASDPAALPGSLVLKSTGAKDVTVNLTGTIIPVVDESRLAALSLVEEDGTYYRYTGTMAKVSYVDETNKGIYIQDLSGAIRINYQYTADPTTCPIKKGDKVKNIYLTRMDDERGPAFIPLTSAIGDVTAHNAEVTPLEVSFTDIKGDLDSHLYKLVTVKDVTITAAEGSKWGTSGFAASDERGEGRVRSFAGTDLIGTDVPAFAQSITGISTSKGAPVITMRGKDDLATLPANLEISNEMKINANEYQKINVAVEYGVFTVKATALTKPVSIYLTGNNRDMFSIDREEIPAGTGIYQVKVTYTPTTPGIHKANILFDATPTELSGSYSMTAKAYDPANPPTITVDASALTTFSAKVGETHKQTITFTTKNFVNYGSIKVETPGSFLLSNTSIVLAGGTYTVDVTFSPKAEGTYTNNIIFTSDLAETVTVPVSGSTTGGQEPEIKQGDELAFEGPALKIYSTDFTSGVANNQPLKLEGWKNVAAQGTRAWWSYTKDGNQVAKVTAYDSNASEITPCQMLLLSPRLDFKNADRRLLCFNVMGEMMTDNMTDRLDVCYVDAKAAEADPDNVVYNVIDGLNIPSIADENGEWARYVLDLDAQNLEDEFYIAFVFTSNRGKENVTTYYIDDFSWGRTDVPFIRSNHQLIEAAAKAGETITTEEVTATGFNLSQPITLSLSGSDADCFTLSTTELPAEGGKFTLEFHSDEVKEHIAIVSMKSGSDALTHVMYVINTDPAGIGSIEAEASQWGDTVSVSDIMGRVLLNNVPSAEALHYMKSTPGTLYLVIGADGKTYKYLAK